MEYMLLRASYIATPVDKTKQSNSQGTEGGLFALLANGCGVLHTCCETPTWELCTREPLEMNIVFLSLSFFFGLHALHRHTLVALCHCTVVCFSFSLVIILWLPNVPHATLGILKFDIWEWNLGKRGCCGNRWAWNSNFVNSPLIEAQCIGKKGEKDEGVKRKAIVNPPVGSY